MADPHPDDFVREIRHRENTKWKYGLTAKRERHLPSTIHTQISHLTSHIADLTPIPSIDWSVSRISREISRVWESEFCIWNFYLVSFCHRLGLSKLLGLLHLLRFFHTHTHWPRETGKIMATCDLVFLMTGKSFSPNAGDGGPCEP